MIVITWLEAILTDRHEYITIGVKTWLFVGTVAKIFVIEPAIGMVFALRVSRASAVLTFVDLCLLFLSSKWTYAYALIVETQDIIIFTDWFG